MNCSHIIHQSTQLSFIHFSYIHSNANNSFITYSPSIWPNIHSSFTHHLCLIHHREFITNLLSIYLSPILYPSLINLFIIHTSIPPASQPSLFHLSVHLPCIHHSSVHHSPATNNQPPSLIHPSVSHPSIIYTSIHLFIPHPSTHYSYHHYLLHHFKYP